MGLKPKNLDEDSWSYTLKHEVGFLLQELADQEAKELKMSKLSTSAFLERTVRKLAEERLPQEAITRATKKGQERGEERRRKAREKAVSS